MSRWPYFAVLLIALCVASWWTYQNRDQLGIAKYLPNHSAAVAGDDSAADAGSSLSTIKPANVEWHTIDRDAEGFHIDMPAGYKDAQAPATSENGSTEQIHMLSASPDGDSTYAITWADNPPVARVNGNDPDHILDQARDGMLASTQTTLITETRITVAGFPGRQILATNAAGGMLNARLIYAPNASNGRLYTLMALFPTAGARSEKDVDRFFSSFRPEQSATKS